MHVHIILTCCSWETKQGHLSKDASCSQLRKHGNVLASAVALCMKLCAPGRCQASELADGFSFLCPHWNDCVPDRSTHCRQPLHGRQSKGHALRCHTHTNSVAHPTGPYRSRHSSNDTRLWPPNQRRVRQYDPRSYSEQVVDVVCRPRAPRLEYGSRSCRLLTGSDGQCGFVRD